MRTVKPSTVCYTVIQVTCHTVPPIPSPDPLEQVYIALSDMITWGMKHEEVDLSLLYDLLRQQLRDGDDPWVKETLQWWDRYVATFLS